jgi:NhaP-type Na+/H+ and K+/H+ antiporter
MSAYELIIAGSLLIILSYLFNIISRNTGIPSVVLLIGTGIIIKIILPFFNIPDFDYLAILEVLGIIGLIMIVLEASLDLKISKDKKTLISRSLSIALLSLIVTGFLISIIMVYYLDTGFLTALVYALPLSIISSAIVIPSTAELAPDKKEFLIYESTFSDILGIMLFYFLLQSQSTTGFTELGFHILLVLLSTIIISFAFSYLLIFIFQNIRSNVKLFLLISSLVLLYSIAKSFKLSSLLLILVFGLLLENRRFFFPVRLRMLINEKPLQEISKDFKIITLESSFVVRTFFFIIFGMRV